MNKYLFSEEHSMSSETLFAKPIKGQTRIAQLPQKLEYPHIHIANRGAATMLSFREDKDPNDPYILELRSYVQEYNDYIDLLNEIHGFWDFFGDNFYCISFEQVKEKWGEELANRIFSLRTFPFEQEFYIIQGHLVLGSVSVPYEVSIMGERVVLPLGPNGSEYPERIAGRTAIWNWVEDGHDFCYNLWRYLGEREVQEDSFDEDGQTDEEDEDERVNYFFFEVYDEQVRGGSAVEPQLVAIFELLEKYGYLVSYTIKPETPDPRWYDRAKNDQSMDVALIDDSLWRDKLIKEKIELLLWTPSEAFKAPMYFLQGQDGHTYLSSEKGQFGGHKKLKIYGRLDCPSAAKYLAKGQYVKQRVFFSDEKTAVAAGYRPCGVCMPEAYKKWKAENGK